MQMSSFGCKRILVLVKEKSGSAVTAVNAVTGGVSRWG